MITQRNNTYKILPKPLLKISLDYLTRKESCPGERSAKLTYLGKTIVTYAKNLPVNLIAWGLASARIPYRKARGMGANAASKQGQ